MIFRDLGGFVIFFCLIFIIKAVTGVQPVRGVFRGIPGCPGGVPGGVPGLFRLLQTPELQFVFSLGCFTSSTSF